MNIFNILRSDINKIIKEMIAAGDLPGDLPLDAVTVEPPREAAHGDLATNAALVLAKPARQSPRAIAEKLQEKLQALETVETVEVAGPGFLNLRLSDSVWRRVVADVLKADAAYGDSNIGAGLRVNVEYVSANPTGPLHVGHVRGAVFGDALASLLEKAGYDVTREYYINDAGAQIDTLARSAYLRYREALGEDIGEIPEGLYPGQYLKPVGEAIKDQVGDQYLDAPEDEWLAPVRDMAVDAMMTLIKQDLADMGIHHDVFFSEKSLHASGRIEEMLQDLEGRGLVYEGVLKPPRGKVPEDWEERPQTLFRATDFGDDVDRPLKKSDGSYTYFAADIAYHYDKYKRGARLLIDVLGADHGGYEKRIKASVKAASHGEADLDVKLCQLVRLFRAGKPVRMSKRSGSFVTLRELLDEVGRDVVRFIMLTRKNEQPLEFDFARVLEQSKDNPVFYVQYAHARTHSLIRKAKEAFSATDFSPKALGKADLSLVEGDSELALMKRMAAWPRTVEAAAEAHEPHRVAFYLYDLVSEFHSLWNKGNNDPRRRFVIDGEPELTCARLALAWSMGAVIRSGLDILGVNALEEMR